MTVAVDSGGRQLTERTTTSPIRRLSSAPSNLRPDSKALTRAQRKPPYLTNVVALSYGTFSLAYLLVEYAFGAAICIAYGDRNGGDEDGRDGARSCQVRRLLRSQNNSSSQNLCTEGDPAPTILGGGIFSSDGFKYFFLFYSYSFNIVFEDKPLAVLTS